MELLNEYLEFIQEDELQEIIVLPAIVAAAAIYRQFYSNAAKKCKGLKWGLKQRCMLKYELDALTRAKKELVSGIKQCKTHKDPVKCKQQLDKKSKKYDTKIKKKREKLKIVMKKYPSKKGFATA